MDERTTISIPTDSDGFLSRKCPTCTKVFKIRIDGSGQELVHCPYCNAAGEDWFTDDQREYVEAVGFNFAQDVVARQLDEMVRDFDGDMPGGGFITAKMSYEPSPRRPLPPKPVESNNQMSIFTPACCNEPVKHDGSSEVLHCIVCGSRTAL